MSEIPDGYILVPEDPTNEMLDAGRAATAAWLSIQLRGIELEREKFRRRYKAMIAAAISPATVVPDEARERKTDEPK